MPARQAAISERAQTPDNGARKRHDTTDRDDGARGHRVDGDGDGERKKSAVFNVLEVLLKVTDFHDSRNVFF